MRIKKGYYKDLILMVLFVLIFFLTSSYQLNFLVWFMSAPLLILVYKKTLKKAFFLSLIASVAAVAISITWVTNYSTSIYLVSSIIFSAFLTLYASLFNLLSKNNLWNKTRPNHRNRNQTRRNDFVSGPYAWFDW